MLDTLLKYLSEDDYDSLIEQEKLRLEGYNIHFIVDAGLIGNYCYPKGINEDEASIERRKKWSADFIADEQVTLHSIFALNKENDRVILFDEHLGEFRAMLLKAAKYNSNNSVDLGLQSFRLSLSNNSVFKEYLYDNFSKIIADVLLRVNAVKKASNLFKEKQVIFEANEISNEFLKEAIQSCRVSFTRRDKIIDLWEDTQLRALPTSKKRDASVVDRILSINHYIERNGKGDDKKHVFILLTDAPSTKPIFKRLMEENTEIFYPRINGKIIHLIRNVSQTFAYLISLAYNDNKEVDTSATIMNLNKLKKTSGKGTFEIENSKKLTEQHDDQSIDNDYLSDPIFNNYRQLRNLFENTGLLKSFEGLHQSLKANIKNLHHLEIQNLFERIKLEMKTLTNELTGEHSQYLSRLYEEAIFSTTFWNGLELLNSTSTSLNLSKGNDFVEGSYQHLPLFITFPLESQNYRENMNLLIMFVFSRNTETKILSQQLKSLLGKMNMYKLDFDEQFEMKLLRAFILMILPSINNFPHSIHERHDENDNIVLRWLESLHDNGKARLKTENEHLYPDLLYQLCWVSRRIGDYPKSLEYALEGNRIYNTDPRFYHGIFLAEYNLYEENKNGIKINDAIDVLDKIIANIRMAQKYYYFFLREKFSDFDNALMQSKIYDTFNNSFCYILSLKAEQFIFRNPNDTSNITVLLNTAREHLLLLKSKEKYTEELPEYYDTEAFLEYLESFYVDNQITKILDAKKAIDKAIKLSFSKNLSDKYRQKLDKIVSRSLLLERAVRVNESLK